MRLIVFSFSQCTDSCWRFLDCSCRSRRVSARRYRDLLFARLRAEIKRHERNRNRIRVDERVAAGVSRSVFRLVLGRALKSERAAPQCGSRRFSLIQSASRRLPRKLQIAPRDCERDATMMVSHAGNRRKSLTPLGTSRATYRRHALATERSRESAHLSPNRRK